MRKKERQMVTVGLILLFAAIGWYAYEHQNSGGVILDLGNTTTNESTSYQLAIADLTASVDQATGHVTVSFSLTNEEHFNIGSVQVLYALNIADPNNATYTALNATAVNGTYSAEIPSKFGDAVYYKVKVTYDSGKTLESEVQSITVKDTTAPTLSNVTLDLKSIYDNTTNTTTYNFEISFGATDNDAIATYYVYWADLGTSSTISNTTTFTAVNATSLPIILQNINAGNYYAFYFVVEDVSGNKAMLYNETSPLVVLANSSATWPQTYPVAANQTG